VCEREPGWKDAPLVMCDLGLNVAIAQVITDVICDAFLIVMPLRLVWKVRLNRAQRIRIMAIFSTTIITTSVALNHAYFVLRGEGLIEVFAALIEGAFSLIVANLSVLIACLFRIKTEEPESVPTIHMHSPIIFAGTGKQHPFATTNTFIITERHTHEDPALITLDTLGSDAMGHNYTQAHFEDEDIQGYEKPKVGV